MSTCYVHDGKLWLRNRRVTAPNPTADEVVAVPEDFCICFLLAVYIFLCARSQTL